MLLICSYYKISVGMTCHEGSQSSEAGRCSPPAHYCRYCAVYPPATMMSWSVVNAAPAKLKPEHGAGNLLRNADVSNRGLCRNRFLFSVSPWVRPHSESYEKRPNSRAKSVTGPIEVIFEHNGKPANQDIAVKQNFPLRFSAFAVYGLLPRLNATSEYGSLFMLGLLGVLIIGLIV
jgi:hypothetical protein